LDSTEIQPATESPIKPRKRWYQRVRRTVVIFVLIPYLGLTMIFVSLQRKMMYLPTTSESLRAIDLGLDPELVNDVQIQTPDGNTLNGWLMKHPGRDRELKNPLVIYFPGNASNRHGRINDLREVVASGFDVLIFDYRGYGDSSGSPSEQKMSSDARLILEFACNELNCSENQIVVFGESLGGAVALSLWSGETANRPRPAGLVLNSTFTSMSATVAWHYPAFPFRYLLLDRWPSIDRIPAVKAPVLVFHGTADETVPVAHGRELSAAAVDARFFEIPGAGHNNIPMHRLGTELKKLRVLISEKE